MAKARCHNICQLLKIHVWICKQLSISITIIINNSLSHYVSAMAVTLTSIILPQTFRLIKLLTYLLITCYTLQITYLLIYSTA